MREILPPTILTEVSFDDDSNEEALNVNNVCH